MELKSFALMAYLLSVMILNFACTKEGSSLQPPVPPDIESKHYSYNGRPDVFPARIYTDSVGRTVFPYFYAVSSADWYYLTLWSDEAGRVDYYNAHRDVAEEVWNANFSSLRYDHRRMSSYVFALRCIQAPFSSVDTLFYPYATWNFSAFR
ncbi:hypothetical protein [Chitinophaga arvensicola]|uniref:Uncharacterized protein n=1 Tax=Chitinophaga arvensicola TaxID=29529 RepID=A0A1I0PRI4_9BACT|nr:hypothetical protein [Chitinophaga arvensicola]SEW16928.1 hypothetical protein SAMN04488122_0929 [Chitinophaga arvensicola]